VEKKRLFSVPKNRIIESPFHPQGNPSLLQLVLQCVDDVLQFAVFIQPLFDLADSMNDRGMVLAAEFFADFRKGRFGHGATEIHGDLAGKGINLQFFGGFKVRDGNIVERGHVFLDVVDADHLLTVVQNVLQGLSGHGLVDIASRQGGISPQAGQGTFQLPDIGSQIGSQEEAHFVGKGNIEEFSFLAEDGHFGFNIGRLNIGNQAPTDAGAESLLQPGDLLGELIAGNDNLPMRFIKRVEGMEEFLLGSFFTAQELDIIQQKDVFVPVFIAEIGHFLVTQAVDQFIGEFFGRGVADVRRWIVLQNLVSDGIGQVGLSQSHTAVDEERIVILGGKVGHSQGGGCGIANSALSLSWRNERLHPPGPDDEHHQRRRACRQ